MIPECNLEKREMKLQQYFTLSVMIIVSSYFNIKHVNVNKHKIIIIILRYL